MHLEIVDSQSWLVWLLAYLVTETARPLERLRKDLCYSLTVSSVFTREPLRSALARDREAHSKWLETSSLGVSRSSWVGSIVRVGAVVVGLLVEVIPVV